MEPRARIAALIPRLGDIEDEVVGRALDAIEAILEESKMSWYDVAEWVRGAPAEKAGPSVKTNSRQFTSGPEVRRQPSAWIQDKQDLLRAYPERSRLDAWSQDFLESLHDQVVGLGRPLTLKQREKLNENLDKLGL